MEKRKVERGWEVGERQPRMCGERKGGREREEDRKRERGVEKVGGKGRVRLQRRKKL